MSFVKGNVPWNKNKSWTDEIKNKISQTKKGKPNNSPTKFKKGQTSPNKGKILWWMIGERNPNWRKFGEKHPCYKEYKVHRFYKIIRETFKYRQWRSDIFTRDEFSCVFCGKKGCELNADHFPKRFIDIIKEHKIVTLKQAIECEELWNINNGRTLCVDCHRKTDTWGRRPYKISSN